MRLLLSYIMSHMYDIHAIVAGAVVVAVMMCIKAPIKRKNRNTVDTKLERKPELLEKRGIMLRRRNFILILMVFPLAIAAFWVLSVISPFVSFSLQTSVMTGVFALCIYAFIEQISEPGGEED